MDQRRAGISLSSRRSILLQRLIWFLCKYKNGKYCTLAHVIELAQVEYDKLFSILRAEPQIEVLINPFVTAYLNDANGATGRTDRQCQNQPE